MYIIYIKLFNLPVIVCFVTILPVGSTKVGWKTLTVGKPWIPIWPQIGLLVSSSQLTATTLAKPFNFLAASLYCGAKFLQWPHHGA